MLRFVLLVIALISVPELGMAEEEVGLIALDVPAPPPSVARAMRERDPHWEFPRYLRREFRESCLPPGSPAFPYLVSGDFDGDTLVDHAFWVVSGMPGPRTMTLHLLESSSGRLLDLDRAYGEQMHLEPLTLDQRGTALYDHHTGDTVVLVNDAPGSLVCWKTSRAWVRQPGGQYRELLTSD
jgi:hypothetical protein